MLRFCSLHRCYLKLNKVVAGGGAVGGAKSEADSINKQERHLEEKSRTHLWDRANASCHTSPSDTTQNRSPARRDRPAWWSPTAPWTSRCPAPWSGGTEPTPGCSCGIKDRQEAVHLTRLQLKSEITVTFIPPADHYAHTDNCNLRGLAQISLPVGPSEHEVWSVMLPTVLCPGLESGPLWRGGAAGGSGVLASHWPVGKEEGRRVGINLPVRARCAHHPEQGKCFC